MCFGVYIHFLNLNNSSIWFITFIIIDTIITIATANTIKQYQHFIVVVV
jgi:hypothetical protein